MGIQQIQKPVESALNLKGILRGAGKCMVKLPEHGQKQGRLKAATYGKPDAV